MPSQNAPAPSPSSTRPPLRRSSVAADLASTPGWRSGRLATSGKKLTLLGPAREVGDQRPGVEVAALVRVVLDADEVEAEPVGHQHLLDHRVLARGLGHREDAEQGLHRASHGIGSRPWRDGSFRPRSRRSCWLLPGAASAASLAGHEVDGSSAFAATRCRLRPASSSASRARRFSGDDGCNRFGGRYRATATTLRFRDVVTTAIGCEGGPPRISGPSTACAATAGAETGSSCSGRRGRTLAVLKRR